MYTWTVVNESTGDILTSFKDYKTVEGAVQGVKSYILNKLNEGDIEESMTLSITVDTEEGKSVTQIKDMLASEVREL